MDNDTSFIGSAWYEFLHDFADIKIDVVKLPKLASKTWMNLTSITIKYGVSLEKLKNFIKKDGIEVQYRETSRGYTTYSILKKDKDRVIAIAQHARELGLMSEPKKTAMLESTFKQKTSLGRKELLVLAKRLGVELIYKNNHYSIPSEYKEQFLTEALKIV